MLFIYIGNCNYCIILAIIEMVRDGSTVRAFLLPTFEYVTVMLTGIKVLIFSIFYIICVYILCLYVFCHINSLLLILVSNI